MAPFCSRRIRTASKTLLNGLLAATAMSCSKKESLPVIKRWDTPAWPITGHVLLRYSDPSNEVLLIVMPSMEEGMRFVNGENIVLPTNSVLRYSKPAKHLYLGKARDWSDGSVEIMSPMRQHRLSDVGSRISSIGSLVYNRVDYSATCNSAPLEAKGKAILGIDGSPNGQYVSVLSAKGRPRGGIAFLSAGRAPGDHFVEIFDSTTCQRIGGAVKLEKPDGLGASSICWAPDSELVVFQDLGMNRWLWFVHVEEGTNDINSTGNAVEKPNDP